MVDFQPVRRTGDDHQGSNLTTTQHEALRGREAL